MIEVRVTRAGADAGISLPTRMTEGSAGYDLQAAVASPLVIKPGEFKLVPTGLAIALPVGYEAQVRPRSGLASKKGVTVLNSPGTVDSDYRGEIAVCLINHGKEPFLVDRGMRIAQLVVAKHETVTWKEVHTLDETVRGAGGFGSTST